MAKPPPKSAPPSSPRPPAPPNERVLLGYRILKLIALVGGLPAATLCLMALVGSFTDNGYARVLVALVVVFAVPLFIADRLLPAHDPTRARGLVSDVCAVTWMLIAFLFVGVAGVGTRPMLTREGDRLVSGGHGEVARAAYLLAAVRAEEPPAPAPAASGSADADAGAAPSDAGAASSASASASAAPDAGPPKAKSAAAEKTPAELFKDFSPSVVTIFVHQKGGGEGSGTGFVVDRDGTIATNHHVIDNAGAVRVKYQGGTIFEDVELLADEPALDLALIHVNLAAPLDGGARPDAAPLALGDSDAIVVGEHAVSIGNPLGLEHTLTDGLVSSRRLYEGRAWIQFSAPVSPGNSGGPLFNMRGEVIGVTTAIITGRGLAQNLNLAVPINELKKLFRPVYPGRRRFGDGTNPSHW